MIEASGLEEVPEAFFVSARVKCDLYRFFPVVGTFPTELSGRGRFLFRIRKGVKKIVFHNFFMIIEYIYHLNLNNF
ncbi:hypothetical protein DW829_17635 [Phocaeicola vulgatus]|nr:hypothetical protein DW829_17635 [Phocaeicola vulgatus]RHK75159.1 hypothetical protein DW048_05405 [Phocaeicola vulgatus]